MNVNQNRQGKEGACHSTHALLSQYIDSTLSARQMLEVERHLSDCKDCATQAQQMQATVRLLRQAPRYDTRDDFMAKLHARLDHVEPERARRSSPLARLRDWATGLSADLRRHPTPAFGMALALTGLAAVLIVPQLPGRQIPPVPGNTRIAMAVPIQQALDRHLADVASDPLGDVAAEQLAANANQGEDSAGRDLE